MIDNTTIWTQTNLAQWAENSNRGSWYKYTQASRSFNSYIKSKISTSANLISNIEGVYPLDRVKDLYANIKGLGNQNINLLSVLQASRHSHINLNAYTNQFSPENKDLPGYIKYTNIQYLSLPKAIRSWVKENIDLRLILQGIKHLNINLNAYTNQFSPENKDLPGYIKYTNIQYLSLPKAIRSWVKENIDLRLILQGIKHLNINLNAYTNQFSPENKNLPGYIKYTYEQYFNFKKIIRGWGKENIDLLKYIKGTEVLYSNLGSFLRGKDLYTLFDLSKYIKSTEVIYISFIKSIRGWGKDNRNLGGYTKLVTSGNTLNFLEYVKSTEIVYKDIGSYLQTIPPLDLSINIELIEPLNLQIYLTVNDKIRLLRIYITSFQERSLSASITPLHVFNLNVNAVPIPSVNISAYLYGWVKKDLGSFILAKKWPELIAKIVPVPSINLKAMIAVYKGFGIESNLNIIIGGVIPINLSCYLSTVQPVNLNMVLIPSGQIYDLNMQIKPKVIFMKAIIYVALLEHIDLNMSINNGCVFSMYKDLPIYFHTLYYKQLLAYIQPKLGTNLINDLGIEMNNVEYIVTDFIDVSFFTGQKFDVYNTLKIEYYSPHIFIVEDTITLCFSKCFSKDLNVVLQGVLQARDLIIKIRPISLPSYKFSPEWIDLVNKRIVMNINKMNEQWRRVVELFFDTGPKDDYSLKYIYVDGLQKVFKEDRNRFWQVVVTTHLPNLGRELPQKLNIRNKYLIKLSDFSTVDEAVKYLIDMVSTPRSINLKGLLNAIEIPKFDLRCYLSVDFKYRWSKNLKNIIIGDHIRLNLPFLLKCGYFVMDNLPIRIKSTISGLINLQNRIGYISTYSFLHTFLRGTITDNMQLIFMSKALYKKHYDLITTVRYYYGNFDLVNAIKSKKSNIEKNLIGNLIAIDYIVPDSNNIVFNFTDTNYIPPEHNDLNFNFVI